MPQRDPHSLALMKAADSLGISYLDHFQNWGDDAVEFTYNDQKRLVLLGRIYPELSFNNSFVCDNKHITKLKLKELGIPVPSSILIDLTTEEGASFDALDMFMEKEGSYVAKPLVGTNGHGVAVNLRDRYDVEMHIDSLSGEYTEWLIEEQVMGEDLRIQVIGGELVAACVRIPAFVVGDGMQSLEELIGQYNQKIGEQNPENFVEIDAASRQLMREQEIYLSDIVELDRKIQLKYVSNMGQGGLAVDKTDEIHPLYREWMPRVAAAFGLRNFAFDAMATDLSASPETAMHCIELNAQAQWLHHTFSEGRTHDMPSLVLKDLFGM